MDQPSFDVSDLTYPGATVLHRAEYRGLHNLLLATPDGLGGVWRWYARRLGLGVSQASTGGREFEAGPLRMAVRRTPRVVTRDAPFDDAEHPQAFAVQQGERAVAGVLSRDGASGGTSVALFVFG